MREALVVKGFQIFVSKKKQSNNANNASHELEQNTTKQVLITFSPKCS